MRHGFSLVELSIVLVILGLLTGGILSGQSLIRASEMRSIISDLQRYQAATRSFEDKYFALPGDMTNATAFWNKDNTNCPTASGTVGTPGTCNGDGDGTISFPYEGLRYWQHLALAGLIEGNYSGTATITGAGRPIVIRGTNAPAAKVTNASYFPINITANLAINFEFGYTDGETQLRNYLMFGGVSPVDYPDALILKPEEAWNIDTKLDDGKPGTGSLKAGSPAEGCTVGTTIAATYNLSSSTILCRIGMVL